MEARIEECYGEWARVSHCQDPVTVLAREVRDLRIVQMRNNGMDLSEIGRRFGLGRGGVFRALQRTAGPSEAGSRPRDARCRVPTKSQVEARMRECKGRWVEVSGDQDELTVLARARRNELIATKEADGISQHSIAREFGLSLDTVKLIVRNSKTGAKPVRFEPDSAGETPLAGTARDLDLAARARSGVVDARDARESGNHQAHGQSRRP
ncbi:hypothetical protein [Amycolatopsis rubida]|uniref:hypothetical protein n=1 Tax=Amycolatopsis rubida TaxID=112413 RepID=UPI0011604A66|nr:hypothetical protein [Amycolatopsis rubida]